MNYTRPDYTRKAVARLRKLIDSSKAGIRVRLTDRAFVRIAATGLCLLMASTSLAAPFRQVQPPARPTYCAPKVIYIVVPVRRERPVIYYGGGWNPYERWEVLKREQPRSMTLTGLPLFSGFTHLNVNNQDRRNQTCCGYWR